MTNLLLFAALDIILMIGIVIWASRKMFKTGDGMRLGSQVIFGLLYLGSGVLIIFLYLIFQELSP